MTCFFWRNYIKLAILLFIVVSSQPKKTSTYLFIGEGVFFMRYFSRFNRFNTMLVMIIGIVIQQKAPFAADCPCDIYSTGGTPCVAAYSTVRTLSSTYTGPLYQVRLKSDTSKTKDIYALTAGGVANSAAQDSFLGTAAGTISKL